MRHLLVAITFASLLGGCTEAPPTLSSKTTEVRTNNTKEKTVEVAQPITVQVANPDRAPETVVKTTTRVETSPTTTVKVTESSKTPSHSPTPPPEMTEKNSSVEGVTETAESVTVMGSKLVQSVEGRGRNIDVQGDDNDITLTGTSSSVTVGGHNNKVNAADPKSLVVNGTGNHVTYTGTPSISKSGSGNDVAKQ